MKEKRGIRWKENSPGLGLHKTDKKIKLISIGASVLFDILISIVFLASAVNMGENAFPEWSLPNGFWGLAVLITLGVIIGMEIAGYLKKWKAILVRIGIGGLGLLCFGLYAFGGGRSNQILSGLYAAAEPYLDRWNTYYQTALFVPYGNKEFREMAMGVLLLALYFVLLYLARLFRKNHITAIFPFAILWAELMIGASPETAGIIVFFAGILLAASNGYKKTI